MSDLETSIKKLEEKLRQAKAKKAQIEAKKRVAEARKQRKDDTRRKILIGAVVMAELEVSDKLKPAIDKLLAERLTRDDDRALFGLWPLPKVEEGGQAAPDLLFGFEARPVDAGGATGGE